jgi:hypothetical protein
LSLATDCERLTSVEFWSGMVDFAELGTRIDALCARASAENPDSRLLVEIENLLAEGYLSALHGDQLSRRLQSHFESLVEAGSGEQLRAVAQEQRLVSESTRRLRAQLATMRERWVALGSDRIGLA